MKIVRVVIAAGGDGTRLGSLNPQRKPKPSLEFDGKPLISFQLELLKEAGLSEILLSFNEEEQISYFKNLIDSGQVPKLKYCFNLHSELNHPNTIFQYQTVKKFISESDFIFTQGDLFLTKNIFKDLLETYQEVDESIVTKELARPTDQLQIEPSSGFMKKITKVEKASWRYGGIYLITKKAKPIWLEMCETKNILTIDFFFKALARNIPIYFLNTKLKGDIINLNTPKEFQEIKELTKAVSII